MAGLVFVCLLCYVFVFSLCITDGLCVCLGASADGLPWDYFSEQTTKDSSNRDGAAWVLGYRTGPACPFLLHEERDKPSRSELYLDLHVSRNLCICAVLLCR